MKAHKSLLLVIWLSLVFVLSCATYKPFMAPGFSGDNLTKGGMAIFPVLVSEGSQNVSGVQGYVRTAGEELAATLKKEQPTLNVIGPTQVSAVLANNNLVDAFSKLKQNYALTGIVDVNLAKEVVDPLGVNYFMLASISALYAKDASTAVATMNCKIFDTKSAEMVFESVQNGDEISIFGGPPYEKAIKKACTNLTRTLALVYKQR